MPLHRLLEAPSLAQTSSLADTIVQLVNRLSPTPTVDEVLERIAVLTSRLSTASTLQVFAAADRLRDTLVAQFPSLRDEQGHLAPAVQQALSAPDLPPPIAWNDAHLRAWQRGLMPVAHRRTLALKAPQPCADRSASSVPATTPVMFTGTVASLDPMDVELLTDALESLRATIETPAPEERDLTESLRPFAFHLKHLPPGRCYVLANAFREAVAKRMPAYVDEDDQGHRRLGQPLRTTLFMLVLSGDTEDDAHDQAMVAACIPGHCTAETMARWVRDAEDDAGRTHALVKRFVQAPTKTVARVVLAQDLVEHLGLQGSVYRELLVLDRLRPIMEHHQGLRAAVDEAVGLMAPALKTTLSQMWGNDQRLSHTLLLALARAGDLGTSLMTSDLDADEDLDALEAVAIVPNGDEALDDPSLDDLRSPDPLVAPQDASNRRPSRMPEVSEGLLDDRSETTDHGPTDALLSLADQMQGLDAAQDLVLGLLNAPVAGHADMLAAIDHLVRTTDSWNDVWFELAWHGVITWALPRWTAHLMPAADGGISSSGLVGLDSLPPVDALAMLTRCAMSPGAVARRAISIVRVGTGLSPSAVVDRRGRRVPLHDPLVETAALMEAHRQEKLIEQREKGATVPVVTSPIREFRNSATYAGLAKGILLKPVNANLDAWQDAMDADFPWLRPLTARLARRLAIQRQHHRPLRLPNLALLGNPGVGKTLYWRTAMRRLEHPLTVLNMAGTNDSMLIKGTTAGWSSERPGIAAHAMATHGLANPVVLLDEIDKAGGGDNNGRAVDALLPLMEASTAATYRDDCLLQEVDAAHISWVLTLNEEDKLPAALRSRVEIVTVNGPDWHNPEHVDAVLRLGEDLAWAAWGHDLRTAVTSLSEAQKDGLRRTRWTSLRSMGQAIEVLVEDNLYQATVETRLRAVQKGETPAQGWRPAPSGA